MFKIAIACLIGLGCLLTPESAPAAENWAFRFQSPGPRVSWYDDLAFHNTTNEDALVTLLGVSNGAIRANEDREIPVPAGRTVSLTDLGAWGVDPDASLWVVRFDVPDGVLVSSRGGLHLECPSPCGPPPLPTPTLGAFAMPVFQSLAPAGSRQFRFGADLGGQGARSNAGIYNAGDAAATAVLSLHRACDDALIGNRVVTIPPNTAVQVAVPVSADAPPCADTSKLNSWLRYVTVVVDQPSVSYVFNVNEDWPDPPRLPFGLAGF
jgi:hypothetical protein